MARRGENIHKRKDGRWEGRYIKARTQEGKIQWGYVYGTVYAEVKHVLVQKKAEAGFYNLKRTDLTFEVLAEVWLHSLRNSIKESTYAHYSYTLHKYLLPVLSKVPVASLDESFLEQAMQQIISPADATHKPLGNSSARECLSMLRRICKYAAHLRLIRPMELEVTLPKAIDQISAPLSPAEQQRLYQYVQENPTPRKIGLLLGVELGLRIGEIQTIVVPYFSFGLLVLLYWQVIERRFRNSDMSFMDSLLGLFSGCYDNLDFNVHLWFLPCFFVTVALFNILVNLGGKKIAYIVSALMSLIYVVLPMPELFWGLNRVFKYIGFYALGVALAGQIKAGQVAERKITSGGIAIILTVLNFILAFYGLTRGLMWFVTAMIGVVGVGLMAMLINQNRLLQYLGRISLMVLCIHGPVYRIVVKIVSIPLQMSTDVVRENLLLALIVVAITLAICSIAYEVIIRIAPWMVGKRHNKAKKMSICG